MRTVSRRGSPYVAGRIYTGSFSSPSNEIETRHLRPQSGDANPLVLSRTRKAAYGLVCIIALIACFITIFMFIEFLSSHKPNYNGILSIAVGGLKTKGNEAGTGLSPLLGDALLLAVFCLQHSIMAWSSLKNFIRRKNLIVLYRCIYNVATCLALQILIIYWTPVPSYFLWIINTEESLLWWWIFTVMHFLAWVSLYGECLIMDLGELLGVKQVYYAIIGNTEPSQYKSSSLWHLYEHMRHPGLLPFLVIFWCHPFMSLDRILLATALTLYLILGFDVQTCDYLYCKQQLQTKMNAYKQYVTTTETNSAMHYSESYGSHESHELYD